MLLLLFALSLSLSPFSSPFPAPYFPPSLLPISLILSLFLSGAPLRHPDPPPALRPFRSGLCMYVVVYVFLDSYPSMSSDVVIVSVVTVWNVLNGSVSVSLRCNSGSVLLLRSWQKLQVGVKVDGSDGV